jgi:murein DD-endopeptidase MepM/ murein hydrolase activator NlpD
VIAGAIAIGIEIPRLLIGRDDSSAAPRTAGVIPDAAAEQRLSAGTPAALATGPYLPIVGKYDIGEGAARFGASRGGRPHEGQDLFAKAGTPLIAVSDGIVVEAASENSSTSGGRGNYIGIYSPRDRRTYVYLHMIHPSPFHRGDWVEAGEQIGGVGCTGSCYGVHLHFEIRLGRDLEAKPIDPLPIVRRWPALGN